MTARKLWKTMFSYTRAVRRFAREAQAWSAHDLAEDAVEEMIHRDAYDRTNERRYLAMGDALAIAL